jgi:hypothetical protein
VGLLKMCVGAIRFVLVTENAQGLYVASGYAFSGQPVLDTHLADSFGACKPISFISALGISQDREDDSGSQCSRQEQYHKSLHFFSLCKVLGLRMR